MRVLGQVGLPVHNISTMGYFKLLVTSSVDFNPITEPTLDHFDSLFLRESGNAAARLIQAAYKLQPIRKRDSIQLVLRSLYRVSISQDYDQPGHHDTIQRGDASQLVYE
ncbi:hypothetical protein PGT21_019403 [Puccinia graminis f. sp. tritici]|uniref:Uncharacterized protein n=1 Tax=Puccinia graminis f. sp. tritici TaxID=56615 RepID=A0A5B0P394_PUCGR|nr:hypothetical protein PGTUg99_030206 [Puccinia graminis f. sp. tritici]KAA1099752.1 hypothetical protein PGT21_019403 [Puccinia graminis f. sp. tritici]